MAEKGSSENRGAGGIYQFDPGKSFFANEGLAGPDSGVDGEIAIFDPASIAGSTGTAESGDASGASGAGSSDAIAAGRTGTGKKPRAPYGSRKAQGAIYLGGWDDLLLAGHVLVSSVTACPELELTPEEAKKVTIALDRVLVHYEIQPSETQKIWANFIGAVGSVYGPKGLAIYRRKMTQKDGPKVVDFIRPSPDAS